MSKLWRRLRFLLRRRAFDRELEEELRFHLEMKAESLGASAARRQFGNPLRLREASRDMWGWIWIETLLRDLRYTFRGLRKKPGFSAVLMLTLALGIGANSAIFSVIHAVLLRPLPYSGPERIVTVASGLAFLRHLADSQSDPASWSRQVRSFESAALYHAGEVNLAGGDEPERVRAALVTSGFFRVFGVTPALGRDFSSQLEPGPAVVMSHGLWKRRFGGDRSLAGRSVMLNGRPTTVLGVMPPGFQFPQGIELWVPPGTGEDTLFRGVKLNYAVARLSAGPSLAQAQTEMDAITARVRPQDRFLKDAPGIRLIPLQDNLTRGSRTGLFLLLGAAGFVLLIACANVANLLLARAAERTRELTLRAALGAGPRRLLVQLMTESLVLALLGGALGVLLAFWSLDLVVSILPLQVPQLNPIRIDGPVLGFAVLLSTLTGLLVGLTPALSAPRNRT